MILDASVDAEFAERGYVHVPGALPVDVVSRASAAVERLYSSPEANIGHPGGRTDGTTQYCSDSGLFELYSHPVLESVARFILRTEAVILQSYMYDSIFRDPSMLTCGPTAFSKASHTNLYYGCYNDC